MEKYFFYISTERRAVILFLQESCLPFSVPDADQEHLNVEVMFVLNFKLIVFKELSNFFTFHVGLLLIVTKRFYIVFIYLFTAFFKVWPMILAQILQNHCFIQHLKQETFVFSHQAKRQVKKKSWYSFNSLMMKHYTIYLYLFQFFLRLILKRESYIPILFIIQRCFVTILTRCFKCLKLEVWVQNYYIAAQSFFTSPKIIIELGFQESGRLLKFLIQVGKFGYILKTKVNLLL